jgi:hypothetical protein
MRIRKCIYTYILLINQSDLLQGLMLLNLVEQKIMYISSLHSFEKAVANSD